ncbi:DUF695 domain-containing protein [Saccharibacillus sp. CPCC 101409]|uniref:DUF695 domain-containing protein n=1 Tax=Saccharibacillus sp. CPCC 101409 TaxID=3058041 RepID=UPI00267147CE|nr:DUF695 domain-containing protein [Saccharibacillus sp. CPCC 101409]MDO3412476.1 DUF695 domain-containing protein [Saccharibacillus sp. CPCC 101409]
MSDHWEHYFVTIEEQPGSIVLDMEIWDELDRNRYRFPVCLEIEMQHREENGFPNSEEADWMNELEDRITQELTQSACYVGRFTVEGVRSLYLYFNSPTIPKETVDKHLTPAGYAFRILEIEEAEPWDFYFEFLYPNEYEFQHIGNRSVIESLQNAGDSLEEPRRVDHWIVFEERADMLGFAGKAEELGFGIEGQQREEGEFHLHIHRKDYVDFRSINAVTDIFVSLAEEYRFRYDGWETQAIKS